MKKILRIICILGIFTVAVGITSSFAVTYSWADTEEGTTLSSKEIIDEATREQAEAEAATADLVEPETEEEQKYHWDALISVLLVAVAFIVGLTFGHIKRSAVRDTNPGSMRKKSSLYRLIYFNKDNEREK